MSKVWVPIFEALLLWLTALFILSLLSAALYLFFRRINHRYAAERRSLALLVYALMTPLTATALLVISFNPAWSEHLIGSHCHSVDCLPHKPQIILHSATGLSMLVAALFVLLSFAYVLQQQWVRSRQRLQLLQALSVSKKARGYRVLNSPALLAWCTGFFRSRIYLSSGLLAALNSEQIEAVLAHERAHARRLDNLRRWLAYIATAAWPSPAKKIFWQDFYAATEEACDRAAATELRSQSPVVAALVYLASAGTGTGNSVPSAHDPSMRIRALLSPLRSDGFPLSICLAIVSLTFVHILVLTSFVHHLLEQSTARALSLLG